MCSVLLITVFFPRIPLQVLGKSPIIKKFLLLAKTPQGDQKLKHPYWGCRDYLATWDLHVSEVLSRSPKFPDEFPALPT